MYLFYTPILASLPATTIVGSLSCLDEEESGHCVRVLRYTRGDEILLTDGQGTTYHARITNPHPKHCEFEVLSYERQQKTHRLYLHIAIAPTKNVERLEWMMEKCTEIGVDEITPILCRFSERKQLRTDRLQKIILSAAKQSLTPYLPKLNELTPIEDVLRGAKAKHKFIAHCYEQDKRELKDEEARIAAMGEEEQDNTQLILIGPEGDFSTQEIEQALALGFVPVGLGQSRLRTETAGVVACHTAVLMNA